MDKIKAVVFLLYKAARLVVTNGPCGRPIVDGWTYFFTVTDGQGNVIEERNYYRKYQVPLRTQGFYASGLVRARDEENDLAIIQVDRIPHDIRGIGERAPRICSDAMDGNDKRVHIFGNPGRLDLWRWSSGHLNKCGNKIDIESTIFPGNSGGPVLDDDTRLIGIVVESELHMEAKAVPVERLFEMLRKLERAQLTSFENRAGFLIRYSFRCGDEDQWKRSSVQPGRVEVHPCYPDRLDFPVKPAIRYDSLTVDEKVTEQEYTLESYLHPVLPEDVRNTTFYRYDARKYHFGMRGPEIILVDSEN